MDSSTEFLAAQRKAIISTLFTAFPLGSSLDRIELYATLTNGEAPEDIAAAVEVLIRTSTGQRAPVIAQLLERCRVAREERIRRSAQPQIQAESSEPASVDDLQRLRELGSYGVFWDDQTGVFRPFSDADFRALPNPTAPPPTTPRRSVPVTRAAINAAWLELDRTQPRRGFGWLERLVEPPF